jgi:hypothetical protein
LTAPLSSAPSNPSTPPSSPKEPTPSSISPSTSIRRKSMLTFIRRRRKLGSRMKMRLLSWCVRSWGRRWRSREGVEASRCRCVGFYFSVLSLSSSPSSPRRRCFRQPTLPSPQNLNPPPPPTPLPLPAKPLHPPRNPKPPRTNSSEPTLTRKLSTHSSPSSEPPPPPAPNTAPRSPTLSYPAKKTALLPPPARRKGRNTNPTTTPISRESCRRNNRLWRGVRGLGLRRVSVR